MFCGSPKHKIENHPIHIMDKAAIEALEKSIQKLIDAGAGNSEKVTQMQTDLKTFKDAAADAEKKNKERDERLEKAEKELKNVQKLVAQRGNTAPTTRRKGLVVDQCARELASSVIIHCARSGVLEGFITSEKARDAMLTQAKSMFGLEGKALTTTEIPLPTSFSGDLRELVAEFGVLRGQMFPYPLSGGTSRPPRFGTRPAFASIAMSGAFAEKKPTFEFASLESHKLGGYVLVPRELEEQSIVNMGQFLARYGAIEFARAEDTWGLLADGTATYEGVTGVTKICADNSKIRTLGNGKTSPSDATLADFRAMRRGVNSTARKRGKYYLNHTWETRLRDFNTEADPNIFMYRPDGSATLDGHEIVWVEVMQEYTEDAAAGAFLAIFGDLQWWWFGERGAPRVDQSEHVAFLNDQLAVRFMEEIDFDYQSLEAAFVLKSAAA